MKDDQRLNTLVHEGDTALHFSLSVEGCISYGWIIKFIDNQCKLGTH